MPKNINANETISKTISKEELKVKLENQLLPLFKRSMSAKHEKSSTYVMKAVNGELPTMRIANRVREDHKKYSEILNQLIEVLSA